MARGARALLLAHPAFPSDRFPRRPARVLAVPFSLQKRAIWFEPPFVSA